LDFAVGRPQQAFFEGFKSEKRISKAHLVKVPVSTIDIEWRQLGAPEVSVVKIDVEGAEGLVLEVGVELLNTHHPDLLIEWYKPYLTEFGTSVDQLLFFAREFDYRIYTVPTAIPVDDVRTLRVQMMACSNFLLLH